ncbi:hypothetical protein H4Q26_016053 [Puccinia striiformis f. sp. tritici PST-130]|nr:hypothetical protein H4Q26_016053 [Puccinia striiformis f. sp. tritici PST-130]
MQGPPQPSSSRKRLDPRIQSLIKNCVKTNHRSFFIVLGDKAVDQAERAMVLQEGTGFHLKSKEARTKIKREVKKGHREVGDMDPFELFVSLTDIRYTYYKETEKILGQTFGMLVLQDFEALTPNLLARTIETVTGGGIVVLLLNTMKSLKQLYTLSMDVHERYRTEAYGDLTGRFNERFLLSLGPFAECLVLDDELNVLPISAGKDVKLLEDSAQEQLSNPKGKTRQLELEGIKRELLETKPIGDVVQLARTVDQAKTIMEFTSSITEKTLSSTVTLTAARGRGNLAALGYEEHLDYNVHQSSNPDWKNCIVRVDIFRNHRQTIQYIEPQDYKVLGQAELVVIDEAAAIPIRLVKNLIGPYLVFMASTINGYEGTGRSLSLKLIAQLRELSKKSVVSSAVKSHNDPSSAKDSSATTAATYQKPSISRSLKELKLEEPIRYSEGDGVEKWLNGLLCLDVQTSSTNRSLQGCPHPSKCDLYFVNRDTLFSYHPASEVFLRRMMSLYVASHYKNSPNDLQLMSDSPSQQLYVLLPPIADGDNGSLPEPLVVIQVALEGKISKPSVMASLSRGIKASGDLIPWTISQQFQDEDFPTLSGARINGLWYPGDPNLNSYFNGQLVSLSEDPTKGPAKSTDAKHSKREPAVEKDGNLISMRDINELPALLQRLSDRPPESLEYLGVSFGLTPNLLKFWKQLGFLPVYIRQTENELTGEHTSVVIRSLSKEEPQRTYHPEDWLTAFALDFRRRFLTLLSYKFRTFPSIASLTVLEAANAGELVEKRENLLSGEEISRHFSPFDLKRLQSYSNNMLDYHVILDLLPSLTELYFSGKFNAETRLSGVQSSILLSLGLQRKSVEDIEGEIKLPVSQTLALFVKVIRKLTKAIQELQKAKFSSQLTSAIEDAPSKSILSGPDTSAKQPTVTTKKAPEVKAKGNTPQAHEKLKEQQRELIDSLDLNQYAVGGDESEWEQVQQKIGETLVGDVDKKSMTVSLVNPNSSKKVLKRKVDESQSTSKSGKDRKRNQKNQKELLLHTMLNVHQICNTSARFASIFSKLTCMLAGEVSLSQTRYCIRKALPEVG